MNLLSVLYILCSIIAFESAVTTFRINRRSPENILFTLFSLDFGVFCLTFSQLVASPDMESAMVWHMVTTPSGMIIAMLSFHFSLALTGRKKWASNPLYFLPLYLPSFYFMFQVFNGSIITGVGQTPWGWDVIYDKNSSGASLGILHGVLCLAASSVLIFRWYYRAGNILQKKQARPVAFAFILGASGLGIVMVNTVSVDPFYTTLVADVVFPLLYITFILGVRISISRYRLMYLHPDIPVNNIIMGMPEACLLVNTGGEIICVNSKGRILVETKSSRKIQEIFSTTESIRDEVRNLGRSKKGRITVRCSMSDKKITDEFHLFNLDIQCVIDEGGSLCGFFIIIIGDMSLSDFQKTYNITARQMEIIHLVVSGLSNIEVAEHLKISERTVENHLFNIYNKIGIGNKIELMNTAAKYKILPGN